MSNPNYFSERNRDFEEPSPAQELLDYQLKSMKFYVRKWMMVIIILVLVLQGLNFLYLNYKLTRVEEKVDYRYFLTKESLEDIFKVKIEKGRVIWRESK